MTLAVISAPGGCFGSRLSDDPMPRFPDVPIPRLSLRRSWSRRATGRCRIRLFLLRLRASRSTHHESHLRPAHHQLFGNKRIVLELTAATHKVTHLDVRQRDALSAFLE